MTALAPHDLRVLLVFPPQGHPTMPYLALPSLKAFLARHCVRGATVWDLNLQAYDELLSGPRLTLAIERIRERAEAWGLHERDVLAPADLDRFRLYADALAAGPYVAARIDEAKAAIRDRRRFYDRERYLWAMRTFEAGLKLISTEYHPALLTAHNYTQSTSIDNAADLFAGVASRDENVFRELFEQRALPRVERERPDVLGLSVTYGSQLVPALTLASLVKQRWPGVHVTMGGGMLAYVGHRLAATRPLFDLVDSIVVYEGEKPMLELCRAVAAAGGAPEFRDPARRPDEGIARGRGGDAGAGPAAPARPDLSGVPNLLWRRDGAPVTNGELMPMPIESLPTPDFTDLPLDSYLGGELVLPVAPTRGCYYEKCGFCTLYTAIGPTYRERSAETLAADCRTLVERHGTPYFYFIMDDLPPRLARDIPDAFARAGLEVLWWCDARLEERIFDEASLARLHAAGLRKLMLGFEAGSQRLLDLVDKGTDLREAERVLRRAHDAGISTTLYTMVGLPTETREEARMTRDFIVRNAPWIGEISLQIFNLDMVSPMYRDPRRYGIAEVVENPDDDLARYLDCIPESGMTRAEAIEAFDEVLAAATEALAALRGDNFLYYRYKSHIFLYLCRFGIDAFRTETPAEPAPRGAPVTADALPDRLALRRDATLVPLSFPYEDVHAQLDRAWSDPAPLGGVARSQTHAGVHARSVARRASWLAYLGDEHRFVSLGADAGETLATADARGTRAALALFGEEHREAAARFLADAVGAGLLRPD